MGVWLWACVCVCPRDVFLKSTPRLKHGSFEKRINITFQKSISWISLHLTISSISRHLLHPFISSWILIPPPSLKRWKNWSAGWAPWQTKKHVVFWCSIFWVSLKWGIKKYRVFNKIRSIRKINWYSIMNAMAAIHGCSKISYGIQWRMIMFRTEK